MKLVPPEDEAGVPQAEGRRAEKTGLAVAQGRELVSHNRLSVEHAGHGKTPVLRNNVFREIHETAALGVNGKPCQGGVAHGVPHALIGRERPGENLGVAAAQIDRVAGRKRPVREGREGNDVPAVRRKPREVFLIIETECAVTGHGETFPSCPFSGNRGLRRFGPLHFREGKESFQIGVFREAFPQCRADAFRAGRLVCRGEAELARGKGEGGIPGQASQKRGKPRLFKRGFQHGGVPL